MEDSPPTHEEKESDPPLSPRTARFFKCAWSEPKYLTKWYPPPAGEGGVGFWKGTLNPAYNPDAVDHGPWRKEYRSDGTMWWTTRKEKTKKKSTTKEKGSSNHK